MNVTAKVTLASKTLTTATVGLTFNADYGSGRNQEWAVNTPSLQLTMSVKPEVAELFELGGAYTLTFTPNED